ncbi:hypothetical protein [Streptomyces sp. NPDC007172]|uniref:hypothetical protein n=1 Tax=Streptomyces sp. NPDC007172 TaxID=3364776 RepID=UPI0036C1AE74
MRTGVGLGMAAIDLMIDYGDPVGPLLCCMTHRVLLVPVASGTADVWHAAHSDCETGPFLRCCATPGPKSPCDHRYWIAPPSQTQQITDATTLHHYLSLVRARMRHTVSSHQPTELMCHA